MYTTRLVLPALIAIAVVLAGTSAQAHHAPGHCRGGQWVGADCPPEVGGSPDETIPDDGTTPDEGGSPEDTVDSPDVGTGDGPSNLDAPACDDATVAIVGQPGQWHDRDLDRGTSIDATGAFWLGVGSDPVRVGGGSGICWEGGHIDGRYGNDFDWDDAHETAAFSMYGPDMTVHGLRVHLEGDLINLKAEASDFSLSRIHLSEGRDDCIENDYVHSGVLESSLLDGCYTALSARPSSDRDDAGPDNLWTMRDNLIRLQPMEHVYKPEKYGAGPGHGQFFKWGKDGDGVGLSLHRNVFMAEQLPNDGDSFAFPGEYLRSCSDNVIVWLGEGPFPGDGNWPDDCFAVTTDRAVWDAAVTAWTAR